jgi:hypothetical protein
MAIRFTTAGDFLDYTGGAPANTSTTFVCWAYMAVNTATNADLVRFRTSGDGTVAVLTTFTDGVTIRLTSPGNGFNGSYVFTPGVWAKVACTVAGTTGTIYAADGQSNTILTTTGTLTAGTQVRYALAGRGGADTTEHWNGRLAAVKIYNRILTLDEIQAEWAQTLPVGDAGLYAAYTLDSATAAGVVDHSGNGRSTTLGSTITEDGPPIPRRRFISRPWLTPGPPVSRGFVGVFGTGSGSVKIATQTGRAALGAGGRSTPVQRATQGGRALLGPAGLAPRPVSVTGRTAFAVVGRSTPVAYIGMFTYVTIICDYDLATGAAPTGKVSFTPSEWMVNTGATVIAAPVQVQLNADGVISVALAANTDPGTTPTGSYYTVEEEIVGQPRRSYKIRIPYNQGGAIDLATLAKLWPNPYVSSGGYGTGGYGTSGYGV